MRHALENLALVLREKIDTGPGQVHPWIPGAAFADGRILDALVAAEAALEGSGARRRIRQALVLGLDVESQDPAMADALPDLTERQVEWIASWLASEGIG